MSNFFENAQFVSEISVKEKQELETRFNESGIDGCLKYVLERETAWKNIPLNIGVIGASGVGKSSFINAVRKLNADQEGAAAIGVYETTKMPTPYEHPSSPNLKLWDLPGVGTLNYPQSKYLKQIKFKRYDFFIVMTASRFTEIDAWLAKCISDNGKQSYFVRTKMCVEIENDEKAHPKTHNSTDFEAHIRCNLAQNLKQLDIKGRAFVIDSYEPNRFDFSNLENYLLEDYPNEKRLALIRYVMNFIDGIVIKKFDIFRKNVKYFASLSAAVAMIPTPFLSAGTDIAMITYQVKCYYNELGLSQQTLQGTASFLALDNECLTTVMHQNVPYAAAFVEGQLIADDVAIVLDPIMNQKRKIFNYMVVEELFRIVPVVGGYLFSIVPIVGHLFVGLLSFNMVDNTLTRFLDALEMVALKIVKSFVEKTI